MKHMFMSFETMFVYFLGMTNYVSSAPPIPRRYVAFTATFSKQHTIQQIYEFLCTKVRFIREDIRLWKIGNKDDVSFLLYTFLDMKYLRGSILTYFIFRYLWY